MNNETELFSQLSRLQIIYNTTPCEYILLMLFCLVICEVVIFTVVANVATLGWRQCYKLKSFKFDTTFIKDYTQSVDKNKSFLNLISYFNMFFLSQILVLDILFVSVNQGMDRIIRLVFPILSQLLLFLLNYLFFRFSMLVCHPVVTCALLINCGYQFLLQFQISQWQTRIVDTTVELTLPYRLYVLLCSMIISGNVCIYQCLVFRLVCGIVNGKILISNHQQYNERCSQLLVSDNCNEYYLCGQQQFVLSV